MENASKALIIAGAILLSILIIGLGMFIYQQAADVTGSANMDAQQVQAYNAEFLSYEGTQRGSAVATLINNVLSHNNLYVDDPSKQISVISGTAPENFDAPTDPVTRASINEVKDTVRSGYTYTVTFATDSQSGLITQVGIQRKTSSGN